MSEFNYFIDAIDTNTLEQFKQLCLEHGHVKHYCKHQILEKDYFGLIKSGYFRYKVFNELKKKEFITGFAFSGEYVGDYPFCLNGESSGVRIEAATMCEILQVDTGVLKAFLKSSQPFAREVAESLFKQIYLNHLDIYRLSSEEQYRSLLSRCPQIVQKISLKEIASYLGVTPTTISNIRRKITFERKSLKPV